MLGLFVLGALVASIGMVAPDSDDEPYFIKTNKTEKRCADAEPKTVKKVKRQIEKQARMVASDSDDDKPMISVAIVPW